MLFAVKYYPRPGRTEAEAHRVRELLMAWDPPDSIEVTHHFHYVGGGGILIIDTEAPGPLYEAVEPFKPFVDVDIEPVINMIEALAISLDIEEWVASVRDGSHRTDNWRVSGG